jgi:hypothetical protein
MQKRYGACLVVVLGTIISISAALASCTPDSTAPAMRVENSIILSPEPLDDDSEDSPSVVRPQATSFSDQPCLECHTNQVWLETMAVAEEKVEAPSSGPG